MTTFKNLLLIDYKFDNIRNINQIKLAEIDFLVINDNFKDLDNNILKNNYQNIGLLLSDNISFNKNELLEYLKNNFINSIIEFVNDLNYINYLNINFDYENNNFTLNYNESYLITLKKLTIYGGIFNLEFIKDINCFINNDNGDINITTNKLGIFILNISYKIFNFNINKILTITINPLIKYKEIYNIFWDTLFISESPEIIPNDLNGIFYVDDNSLIDINEYSGIFNVKKIAQGTYNQKIFYKVNDLSVETTIILNIIPFIQYSLSNYQIKYQDNFESDIPVINNDNYKNGIFYLDDNINNIFNINKINGIITINNNNLETSINTLLIKYLINDIIFEVKIIISIIPNISYDTIKFIENKINIINKPNIISDSKITFEFANDDMLPLIDNYSRQIDNYSGQIILNDYEAGDIYIYIKVNYKDTFFIYKLFIQIEPYINFENNLFLNYGENKILIFDYFKNIGNISIENKLINNNIYELTKEIYELTKEENKVKYYSLLLEYTKNLCIVKKKINFTICPNITYNISNNILYNDIIRIKSPIISHPGGIFNLNKNNNDIILNEDGSIIINNPKINKYLIEYIYIYNNQNFNKILQFNIIPFVEYKQNYEFIYNSKYNIDKPNYYPPNGNFTINNKTNEDKTNNNKTNNNFTINNDGDIKINNLLVGSYIIFVKYELNNQYNEIPIKFLIKPNIEYESSYVIDKKNLQKIKPININPSNGIFKIINNNELFIINKFGEIEINNSILLGIYNIEIEYQINDISSIINTKIIISPEIEFNNKVINIEYGNKYISDIPKIVDKNGLFKFEKNNNNKININENTGIIEIIDNIEPNIYNLNVIYQINETFKKIPININIKPLISYPDINNLLIATNNQSCRPIVYPEGGHFLLEYNKNIIIDNFTGIINFSNNLNLGNYNLLIKYIYNNSNAEFNYIFNVIPNLEYSLEKNNYIFNINNEILIKPTYLNPKNGIFYCNNDNFSIDMNGNINKNINDYGVYTLIINYTNITTITKKLKIIIKPEITYTNVIVNYKENISIKPDQNINKGIFSFINLNDANYFKINETSGEISNINLLDVDNYSIYIKYELDEILLEILLNITILPIMIINDSYKIMFNSCETNIITEPSCGIFTSNDNPNIIIDHNNGNLITNNNLEIGIQLININYTYNNITITKPINIIKNIYLSYEKNITIIKGFEHTIEPLINTYNGEFKIKNNIEGLFLNSKSGIVSINKDISIGNKTINIEYTVNNKMVSFEFNINILAPFTYKLFSYEINYGDNITIEPTIISDSSYFSLVNPEKGITINETNGNIIINGLDVGIYTFNINCFSNNELLNTNLKITIKPIIKYYELLINIKYGDTYLSKIPDINPNYGIFYTDSNAINLNKNGSFEVMSNLDVNIYYFDITYELNNIKTITTIKLIINPIFEYKNNQISFEENNEYYIEMPNYYPKNGRFILVNSPKGITIDSNGIIHLQNFLLVGSYDLSILYKINNINLTNTINIKIMPKFYYNIISHESYNKNFINFYNEKNISIENFNNILEYNTILNTDKPIYNNKGYFDINNLPNNININGDTGVITFKNFDIGNYLLNVKYNILGIFKIYNYQILITPSINYNTENIFYKKYNNEFISDSPNVYPEEGKFYFSETYNYFNVDYNTGKIIIDNNIPINNYEIIVFYEVNDLLCYKNIKIIVYPDTTIESKEIVFNTDIDLEILNYYEDTILELYDLNLNISIPFIISNNILKLKLKEVGNYNFRINASYKDIPFSFDFNLKLFSKINYLNDVYSLSYSKTFISDKPIVSYYNTNGIFEITNKIKGITIDKETGEIYIFDKLQINKYTIIVNYILNNVSSNVNLIVVINPIIEYTNLYNEMLYDTNFKSEIPKVIPSGGIFSINNNNFIISDNGIISNNESTIPPVDTYNINVQYTVKEIFSSIDIIIKIKPIILYNNCYNILYKQFYTINPIKLSPNNGIINYQSLHNNILLDDSTGSIIVSDNCEPNNYLINISYIVNNIETFTSFNLIIDLFSSYNLEYTILHNINGKINLYDQNLNLPIKYKINNQISNNNFIIKNNKVEIKDLSVGIQNLKINYQINKISNELLYRIITLPTLIYNNEIYLIYGEKYVTKPENYSPINGTFKINNNNFSINKNGEIFIKDDFIGTVELNIEYYVNKFKNNQLIKIIVNPYLNYKDTIIEGLFNETLLINYNEVKPLNLSFKMNVQNNDICDKISIDKYGKIIVDKIPIGKYKLNIMYGSELNISNQELDLIIKPVYFYNENNVTLNYGDNKIFIPTTSVYGGVFYTLVNYDGIFLDEINGIIKLNNIIPKKYNLIIYYKYYDIIVNTNLEINVVPTVKYNNNNISIKYKTEILTLIPTYLPLGGKFNFSDKKLVNNNLYIDENNGNIIINDTLVGKYNIEINYIYNNQKTNTNILVEIIPLIMYDNYEIQFYQGIEHTIPKPYLNPYGGKFYLKGDNINKYCKIDIFGKITINKDIPLGIYEFYVSYDYNKVITNNKFIIKIDPFIYYEDVILYYNDIKYIHEPSLLILENNNITNITLLNDKLNITNKGYINMFNNLDVGIHKIIINYKCLEKQYQTFFMCMIKPILSLDINLNQIYILPQGGDIIYDSNYLKILDNQIIFEQKYNKVSTSISYKYNDIEEIINMDLESKPIKIYDENIERIYGDNEKIYPLINFGNFNSKNYPKKIIINNNGEIDICNLDVGNYIFNVTFTIRNIVFDQKINITIKPKILYTLNNLENPILDPPNGDIYIKNNKFKNIKINKNGKLFFQNILPNIYNLTIGYKVNNIISYQDITITYKPTLILNNDNIYLDYGNKLIINDLKIYPLGGIINSNLPCIFNNNELIFEYLNKINIGTHKIEINYSYNNVCITKFFTLILKPVINYLNKEYKINYGDNLFINSPIISHNEGLFKLNIKHDINNKSIENNNKSMKNNNGLIDINNGSIDINNLDLGKYIFNINYQINSHTITDIIKVTVNPYFNYKQNFIYTIYSENNKLFSEIPVYYPLGGIFYLDMNNENINQSNENINQNKGIIEINQNNGIIEINNINQNKGIIEINQNNGIIEINNINIGNYNLNITYKYQKIILKEKFNIIINPSIAYNDSFITVKYGCVYIINKPLTSHPNGIFSCKNLPQGFLYNKKTGIIIINQKENADIKLYNLIINYTINNLTTTTNICINII